MALRRDARTLKDKALCSMRVALERFNAHDDSGRHTVVLLHLQHAFEMLLKAGLVQARAKVVDTQTGRSIGFGRCLHEAQGAPSIKLTADEAGTLRAIDALRDDEQHWHTSIDEGLLYLHARAAVTIFDDLLSRVFDERLADHLALRVLPLGTKPPLGFVFLVDREFARIQELLAPKRRAVAEAEAAARALLAMEAHVDSETRVSATDVRQVIKGVRAGKTREQVFPSLSQVGADVEGSGLTFQVRITKGDGLAMRYVSDEGVDAAAVRVVDQTRKYHMGAKDLADKVGLTTVACSALREHLGLDSDAGCLRVFTFGASRMPRYSDNAYRRLRDAVAREDLDANAVWAAHRRSARRPRPPCDQPGCAGREPIASERASQEATPAADSPS